MELPSVTSRLSRPTARPKRVGHVPGSWSSAPYFETFFFGAATWGWEYPTFSRNPYIWYINPY